jgi:hypothetical protein
MFTTPIPESIPESLHVASPEIAQFDGISVRMHHNEHEPPHILAVVGPDTYKLTIPDALPTKGAATNSRVQAKIREWFQASVPNSGVPLRTVGEIVYDQWLRVRNGKSPEKVLAPDQIAVMQRGSPEQKQSGSAAFINHYAIDRVIPLEGDRLEVFFRNGEIRIADIWAMRGANPHFKEAFEKFDQGRFTPFHVEWEVGDNTVEIEDQDLWGAGDLRGIAPP